MLSRILNKYQFVPPVTSHTMVDALTSFTILTATAAPTLTMWLWLPLLQSFHHVEQP